MQVLEQASPTPCKTPATSTDSTQAIVQREKKNSGRSNSQQILFYLLPWPKYTEAKRGRLGSQPLER